jgi:predicted nucleic acid-binding protein
MMSSRAILIDTSTLFSGLGWFGPPYEVLLRIHGSTAQLVVTDYILDELFTHLSDFPTDRKEPALRAFEQLYDATVIPEDDWQPLLEMATEEVGEDKDAPIMAAYLLDEIDVLVTSNTTDFPLADYETILTPREFLDTYYPSDL